MSTPPAKLALIDQYIAALGVELDTLVEVQKRLGDSRGMEQGAADIAAMLGTWDPKKVSGIAAVAVLRLAQNALEGDTR
jgi:hypothetical protein